MTTPTTSHSRVAIWIALVLGVLGVAAVVSGAGLLLSAPEVQTASSTLPVTTAITAPGSTVVTAPTTTSTSLSGGFESSLTLTDDTGTLTVSVPVTWIDIDLGPWDSGSGEPGTSISASTDRASWVDGWGTPGIFVGATSGLDFAAAFGDFSGACLLDETLPLEVDGMLGAGEWWNDCGTERSEFFVGVLQVMDGSGIILFQILAVDGEIHDLVEAILSTFSYQ